jgi:hypothetical protein
MRFFLNLIFGINQLLRMGPGWATQVTARLQGGPPSRFSIARQAPNPPIYCSHPHQPQVSSSSQARMSSSKRSASSANAAKELFLF